MIFLLSPERGAAFGVLACVFNEGDWQSVQFTSAPHITMPLFHVVGYFLQKKASGVQYISHSIYTPRQTTEITFTQSLPDEKS